MRGYFGHFYEFVMEDRVVGFGPEYASETVRRFFDIGGPYAHVAKGRRTCRRRSSSRSASTWDLHAVLGRLRARANFRRIAEELWPIVDGPPSTPMGEAGGPPGSRRAAEAGPGYASGTQFPWKP
ncbi:MAG: hypothetical protein KatS3mg010_1084 [Acidimicrobiia bacterium]|nr:MAG: hypothetical protein KatS3mg010_1084 [Acidimicrobiia bacterium]